MRRLAASVVAVWVIIAGSSTVRAEHGLCCPPRVESCSRCNCQACTQQPLVIHCCPGCSHGSNGQESANTRPEAGPAPEVRLVQSTPNFGFGMGYGMPMMMMPMPMPVSYQAPQQSESANLNQDCCKRLEKIEESLNNLAKDLDRVVEVVDRHSLVLERLTEYLDTQPRKTLKEFLDEKSK